MSAILALFHRNREPASAAALEAMMAASRDRSVDSQEVWVQGPVALGHQHFWVTPEELGERQPLVSADGSLVLSCDSRLDNRATLLTGLGLTTPEDRTQSDAALILRAYRQWGTTCVAHLLGDFCFALWDTRQQHLLVAVDALGTRSLCTYIDRDRCLVASEIASLLAHPAVEPRLNEGKVAEFLARQWRNQEETFYEGITYCPPAHCLLVTVDSMSRWRYWDVDPDHRIRYRSDGEYAEQYLQLLTEAVRCRLRSSGPVGISLSGGLDSSSLAALSSSLLAEVDLPQRHMKSFSYTFDQLRSCDEREYIQPVIDRFRLEASYIPSDDRWTLRDADRWPLDQGFVVSDPYAWLPLAVMEAAQGAGCRVLLAGHYGDVLFTGGQYWVAELIRGLRLGTLGRIMLSCRSELQWRTDLWECGLRTLIPGQLRLAYRRLRPRQAGRLHPGLHSEFVVRTDLQHRIGRDSAQTRFRDPGLLARYRSLTLGIFSQGAAATRKLYNGYGLELATPYWDRRLVEFVMALPADQLGRPGRDRWIHRNAMRDLLPESIRERRGRTVFLPLFEKGLHQQENMVREILTNPQIVERRMVRADWLEEALQKGMTWHPEWDLLWPCVSLELWLRRYW